MTLSDVLNITARIYLKDQNLPASCFDKEYNGLT